ncbi:hypothetical protein [Cesiribacter sp. SM1]|uniref:hypothetical protein n=1 Tax=Cesiribacter sp. SM1 TaxID=2861196 RepID=UPI001CD2E665|nr:hypothetical protein [Cesiribacter sp. SM1]
MKVFAKYFHVSRIPSFPLGKIGVAVCQNCNHSVDNQGFSHLQQYQLAFRQIEKKTTIPYWSCAGIGLLLMLMSLVGYSLAGI